MPIEQPSVHHERDRAESFGTVAAQYDRARPEYPDALLLELATLGGLDVLDVACGTGKAAALLADRGLRVLGVEIDPDMAEVARSHGIEVEVGAFETWPDAGRRFDLITCAQAWHWVEPVAGAAKAFSLLRPGGTLALFWNVHSEDADVRAVLDEVYAQHAPSISGSFGRRGGEVHRASAYADRLEAAGFTGLTTREFAWEQVYTSEAMVELLPTYSDHVLLPGDQLPRLLAAIRDAVDGLGGSITAHYATQLLLARRRA